MEKKISHIKLKKDPIKVPVESADQKFIYDPCNQHLISLSGRSIHVSSLVQPEETKKIQWERDGIFNAKLSLCQNYIGIQYDKTQVEFINLKTNSSFVQSCKRPNKPTEIHDYYWTFEDNIFFVTSNGIELYQFPQPPKRKDLKLIKEYRTPIPWFVYSTKLRLLLVPANSSNTSTTIQGYHFIANNIQKIPKFVIEHKQGPLQGDQLLICQIYGNVFCLHLHSSQKGKKDLKENQQISLYQLTREIAIQRYVFNLPSPGKIAIHIVDNLLVIHNTETKLVMLFDIKQKEHAFPVASPLPLSVEFNDGTPIEIYSPHWKFFQPHLILDTKHGYLWQVELNLKDIAQSLQNKKKLVLFLLKRKKSKTLVLQVLKNMIEECEALPTLSQIFDKINQILSTSRGYFIDKV